MMRHKDARHLRKLLWNYQLPHANWSETSGAKPGKEYRLHRISSEEVLNKQRIMTGPEEGYRFSTQNWYIILLKIFKSQQKNYATCKEVENQQFRGDNVYFLKK